MRSVPPAGSRSIFLSLVFVVLGVLGLGGGGCSGNGHIEPSPFRASVGDTTVNCNCNLSFNHSICTGGTCRNHFSIKLCLPPALNSATIDAGRPPSPAGTALKNLTADEFATRVDDYCRREVTNIVYHLISVWNGGWCEYKEPFSPAGGIGESVSCFAQPLSGDGTSATEAPAAMSMADNTCSRPCPRTACTFDNCHDVQDDFGNINLDRCQCNQVTMHECPGDPPGGLPTPVFCRP